MATWLASLNRDWLKTQTNSKNEYVNEGERTKGFMHRAS